MGRLKALRGTLSSVRPLLVAAPDKGGAPSQRRSDRPINTAAWQRARAQYIRAAELQAVERGDVLRCAKTFVVLSGKYPAPNSPTVDHKVPDRGDPTLFWDESNWQIVAKGWHDSHKQAIERRGLA